MSDPRIFYYCHDSDRPFGGEKESYQHVDVLNRHGIEAYALHERDGFRFTWFPNDTRVAYWSQWTTDDDRDYLVLPETLGLRLCAFQGRKVIFNKGIYSGFNATGISPDGPMIYLARDVVGVFTVSHHNRDHLRFAYGDIPIFVVSPDIKPDVFAYRPLSAKRPLIAYSAKASTHGRALYQLLRGRTARGVNGLGSAEWTVIADRPEHEVVATLQDALIFLFLSVDEGLGRLPLEAMACGSLVCAYDAGPLSETLPDEYRFTYGDLPAIASYIERVLEDYPDKLSRFDGITAAARRSAERYSTREQERTVIGAWTHILARG